MGEWDRKMSVGMAEIFSVSFKTAYEHVHVLNRTKGIWVITWFKYQ